MANTGWALLKKVDKEIGSMVREYLENNINNIFVDEDSKIFSNGALASHVLGFTG